MSVQYYEGVGRRKTSTARVRLFPNGNGNVVINDKPAKEFLPREGDLERALKPLQEAGMAQYYNVSVHVQGGGITGQTDAIRMGLARALLKINPDLRSAMRKGGFLTRDPRVKERKKPGLKRARKAPTYTKR